MPPFLRNFLIGLVAAVAAGLVTVALPLLNHLMHGSPKKATRVVAEVNVVRSLEPPPPPPSRPERAVRQPERARPMPAAPRSGPRFAMELGVMGASGAAAPPDLVNRTRGAGGRSDEGVDERPAPASPPPFRIPDEVRKREQDAYLLLSFCVDAGGRPYDIRVAQERPAGAGMASAGIEALRQTRFSPARKGSASVPFCGLEQPFEVRFSN